MSDFFQSIVSSQTRDGVTVPPVIYGTAEKSDASIIFSALASGARGLDTACQPKNYDERAVGDALQIAFRDRQDGGLGLSREEIYVQSKFTTPTGHTEATLPYCYDDPISVMVKKSIRMTLSNLRIQHVDALLLHAPMPTMGETLEVWRAMEMLVAEKYVKTLGVCNIDQSWLEKLHTEASIKPSIVQNRFWSDTGYDENVRSYCENNALVYQAFWVIRANECLLTSSLIGWLSHFTKSSKEDALFLAVLSSCSNASGISVLTGTKGSKKVSSLLNTVEGLGRVPPPVREAFLSELHASTTRQQL